MIASVESAHFKRYTRTGVQVQKRKRLTPPIALYRRTHATHNRPRPRVQGSNVCLASLARARKQHIISALLPLFSSFSFSSRCCRQHQLLKHGKRAKQHALHTRQQGNNTAQ